MYGVIDGYVYYIFESQDENKIFYKNITNEWLNNANKIVREVRNAKYVIKNGKRYYANKTNKIIHKNREVENALWYANLMGGKLVYLPTIGEDDGVQCAIINIIH